MLRDVSHVHAEVIELGLANHWEDALVKPSGLLGTHIPMPYSLHGAWTRVT